MSYFSSIFIHLSYWQLAKFWRGKDDFIQVHSFHCFRYPGYSRGEISGGFVECISIQEKDKLWPRSSESEPTERLASRED